MNHFRWLRFLDAILGGSLLRLLHGFRLRRPPEALCGPLLSAQPGDRILVIKLLGLGSTVHAMDLLEQLKARGLRIHFVGFSDSAEWVELSNLCEQVTKLSPRLSSCLGQALLLLVHGLIKKPKIVIDLEPTSNLTACLCRLIPAQAKIGFLTGKAWRERSYSHLVSYQSRIHLKDNFRKILALFAADSVAATSLSAKAGFSRSPGVSSPGFRILLNMNASEMSIHRLWPEANWLRLISHLATQLNSAVQWTLTGSSAEVIRVGQLEAKLKAEFPSIQLRNLAGRTNIRELVTEIQAQDLVISVDSAVAHIANYFSIPVIALYGPEHPTHMFEESARAKALSLQLSCSPCLTLLNNKQSLCADNQCMKRIPPDWVAREAKELLVTQRKQAS